MIKNGVLKLGPIKRYNYGDIVLFKVADSYIQGKIIASCHSCYLIICDDVKDRRWEDGIFRVGITEVECIRVNNKRMKHDHINYS